MTWSSKSFRRLRPIFRLFRSPMGCGSWCGEQKSQLSRESYAVKCSVTLKWMFSRRPCRIRNKQYKIRKLAVITVKKSIPAIIVSEANSSLW
jgi:hypothetical protein